MANYTQGGDKEIINSFVGLSPWKLYSDGSKRDKGSGTGVLVVSPQGYPTKIVKSTPLALSKKEAEYQALIIGLQALEILKARNVVIRGIHSWSLSKF